MEAIDRRPVPRTRAVVRVHRRIRPAQRLQLWVTRLFLWILIPVTLFPCVWVLAVSLRRGQAWYDDSIWPRYTTWRNYTDLLTATKFPLWVANTVLYAGVVGLVQFLMTATAAYAFSRLRFRFRMPGLLSLIVFQLFPPTMTLAANYILLLRLHLYDTRFGYILVNCSAVAFTIWLLKGYMDNLPRELDEAAMVDGANLWQVFVKIILPLCRPFIAVQLVWSVLGMFSEFLNATVFLKNPNLYPLTIGMNRMIGGSFQANDWPKFAAGAVLTSVPLVIIWMLLQKHLVAGLTRGAVKG